MHSLEQKKRYDENRKKKITEQKAERQKEKLTGSINSRRLAFARNLIKKKRMTFNDLADRMGMTQQALSWIFNVQDDCYISILKRMMDCLGIDCNIRLTDNRSAEKKENTTRSVFEFSGNVNIEIPEKEMPAYVTDCGPDSNLRFLADYIEENFDTIGLFIKAAESNHTSLKGFFNHDDIKLSILCSYAEKLGAKIHFELNEQKDS